ncbi:hypothetical protein LP421_32770 (plasmid) [Rhizobium sp. RCAM05350]|uniref:hypothetical protein n=1 Tax=Rhizobium sp. RCAM05350 TaxID=2895568 RepID=UPI0020768E64|nr:hypothetical protein [Rhizobium sp. RCAM05350]URK89463.1 hypothetical protein LP421_32770 [Rhizobium sp. RCAM05350]
MNTIGRTQHEGTSDAGQRRYDAKRDDAPSLAATARSQSYMQAAHTEWHKIQGSQRSLPERAFVKAQVLRLEDRRGPANLSVATQGEKSNSGSQFRTHLVKLFEFVSEGDDMRHMTRPEFEAYEKRVETALFQAERTMQPEDRKDFEEIATAAREHVNVRRELVDLLEERIAGETSDPRTRVPAGDDRQDEKQRWNDAVERHGFAAADAANKALLDIERAREGWAARMAKIKARTNYER